MKKHNETIDITRCLLIALMVFVHVVNFGDRNPGVKYAILSFMMPTFLVITGYLVNVRKSVGGFLNYLLQLFLPYVIMVSGYMVMSLYLPVRDGITTLDAATVCRVLFVTSIGPYWFLRVMMVCGLCYYLVYRLLNSQPVVVRFCMLAALLIVLSVYTPLDEHPLRRLLPHRHWHPPFSERFRPGVSLCLVAGHPPAADSDADRMV